MTRTVDVEKERVQRYARVATAARRAAAAKRMFDKAQAAMYEAWRDAHGPRKDGGLSYQEIADASDRTRNRVRQVLDAFRAGKTPADG